jgi:hypothetical protein
MSRRLSRCGFWWGAVVQCCVSWLGGVSGLLVGLTWLRLCSAACSGWPASAEHAVPKKIILVFILKSATLNTGSPVSRTGKKKKAPGTAPGTGP